MSGTRAAKDWRVVCSEALRVAMVGLPILLQMVDHGRSGSLNSFPEIVMLDATGLFDSLLGGVKKRLKFGGMGEDQAL